MRTITFFVACCIHLGVGTLMAQASADRITGTWNGKAFDGKYQTTAVESGAAIDDGTWSAARGK